MLNKEVSTILWEPKEPRYGHFNQLIEASISILQKKISVGEFEEILNQILSIVKGSFSEIEKVNSLLQVNEETKKELEFTIKGLSLFEKGIYQMRKFIDTNDRNQLVNGLKMVQQASDILNIIMEIQNKKTKKNE